jgi:hypothetical protein
MSIDDVPVPPPVRSDTSCPLDSRASITDWSWFHRRDGLRASMFPSDDVLKVTGVALYAREDQSEEVSPTRSATAAARRSAS